jgi:hypothetical protein
MAQMECELVLRVIGDSIARRNLEIVACLDRHDTNEAINNSMRNEEEGEEGGTYFGKRLRAESVRLSSTRSSTSSVYSMHGIRI